MSYIGFNNNSVSTRTIQSLAVTTAKIDNLAVTTAKIGLLQVTTAVIDNLAVTTGKIDNLAVTTAKIDNLGVTTAKIDNLAVTDAKILTLTANKLTAGTIDASVITVKNLDAAKITTGVLAVGGSGEANAILIKSDASHGDSNLRWQGGSRVWEDSSNQMGLRSAGSLMIFYTGNYEERLVLNNGASQSYTKEGTGFRVNKNAGGTGGNFNVEGDARVNGKTYCDGGLNVGGVGDITKNAILQTTKGYRALYCMESPEVWFMDFCESKDKIDPLFLEVTEPPYHFIKCEDRELQVWGIRQGMAKQRFEEKTQEQFDKNNKFWSTPNRL